MTGRSHALDLVPGLRELAQAQLGVVRRDQLRALGVTHEHVRQQVAGERWRCIGPQVVVLQSGALRREQQVLLGQIHVGPHGLLTAGTALEVAGLRGWMRPLVHVRAPRGQRISRLEGVIVHGALHMPEARVVAGRWRCVPPAEAAIEAAAYETGARSAAGLVLAVAQQRIATPGAMLAAAENRGRFRHSAVVRRALIDAGMGAESRAEADVAVLVRRAGLPQPRRQVLVESSAGLLRLDMVVDLADGRTLVIEVDGVHHEDPMQRARDNARDFVLAQLGYIVVRISVLELRADPHPVLHRLRAFAAAA